MQSRAGNKFVGYYPFTYILLSRSWQILTFSPRIVVFIRICGTHNTANEVFHCVHFECPCQPDILKLYITEQASTLTTEEDKENKEEFYKCYESLLDQSNDSLPSTMDSESSVQVHTILPFTLKLNSTDNFLIEREYSKEKKNEH